MSVDIGRIFELTMKGLDVVTKMAQEGKDIIPAVTAIKNIVSKRPEDVSEADLDQAEETLDDMLDEFEEPLTRTE